MLHYGAAPPAKAPMRSADNACPSAHWAEFAAEQGEAGRATSNPEDRDPDGMCHMNLRQARYGTKNAVNLPKQPKNAANPPYARVFRDTD